MMKRLALFALLVVAALPNAAQSQNIIVTSCGTVPASVITLTAGNQGPGFIDTTGKMCTAGGGGAATVADGADVAQGTTTDAACATDNGTCTEIALTKRTNQRLTTVNTTLGTPIQATGGTVGLVAGSAVIGKAGTDQTTPGTTDLFTARYTRLLNKTVTFTPGTSYSLGQNIGGLLTFATGLPSGTPVKLVRVYFSVSAGTVTAFASTQTHMYNATPSTSFADGAAPTYNVADNAKFVTVASNSVLSTGLVGVAVSNTVFGALPSATTVDASGNLYMAFQAGGTITLVSPGLSDMSIEINY